MIALQTIKDYLETNLACPVEFSRNVQPPLADTTTLPRVFVGFHSVIPAHGNSTQDMEIISQGLEDLSLVFEVQILCVPAGFHIIWGQIHDLLTGWYPIAADQAYSGTGYLEGGAMGLENGRLWWLDRWKINFPRVSS